MSAILKTSLSTAAVLVTLALNPAVVAGEKPEPATEKPAAEAVVIEVKAGQVLQIIASEAKPDGGPARRTYAQTAFPIASSFGFASMGTLAVKQKVVSDFAPEAFSFFSWPSEGAVRDFESHPDWPAIKATRPDAWNELKVYSDVVDEDLSLTFDPGKHYSVVVAWSNPENSGDYERYLSGIESAVAREGGRFIYKMRNPAFDAHASELTAPHQLTFVEWDAPGGFARVQKSQEYLDSRQYFASGVSRFEFYWLEPR